METMAPTMMFVCETRISHLVIVIFQMKQRESVALVRLPFLVVKQVEPMILLPIVLVKPLVAVVMSWVINSDGLRCCPYSRLVMCSHLFVLTVKDALRLSARCSSMTNQNTKTLIREILITFHMTIRHSKMTSTPFLET